MTAPVVSEQIAMTAPVLSEPGSLAFVMPEGFTLETTPEPIDDRVKIVEIPERVVAALRFSGRWSNSIFKKKSKEMLEELAKAGMKTAGQVFSMRYNGPFTPWFLRRNEVAVAVESAS
jgi:effector-binding domain-containing protein